MARLRDIIFSVNSFVAAMLALFVSMSIGLERPFWAMATVYIVSQPLTGTVRSKAAYRFTGTLLGAGGAVLIIPPLANAPALCSLVMALWVCACQFLSLLDRTPRSYLFMLAGYTAAIIGFPAVTHPDQVFTIAVLRSEEIGLGVLCATLVHAVVLPRGVTGVMNARLAQIEQDARGWALDALGGADIGPRDRNALAQDITELHLLSTHVPYDTDAAAPTRAGMAALQDRLMLLAPLISAIEDRLDALKATDGVSEDVQACLVDVRQWIEGDRLLEPLETRARLDALAEATPDNSWRGLLTLNLLARLSELMDLLRVGRELSLHLSDPRHALTPQAQALINRRLKRPMHIDLGMALLSVAATFLAVTGACAAWIISGWPEGAIAPMIAAVMCCFYGAMDDPTPSQRGFMIWTILSLPLVALYQFGVLPATHSFVTLGLVLAPPLLILGAFLPKPSLYGRVMPLILGFCMGLALTNTFSADFAAFANANFAQVIGIMCAVIATRLIRVIGPQTAAQRVLRAGWRDLAAIAARRLPAGIGDWTGLMLDRAQLLAPRLAASRGDERLAAADALRDLRVGINLIVLREAPEARDRIDALLDAVAAYYAEMADREESAPSTQVRDDLDGALAETTARDVRIALTGLRRNLFPGAAAPRMEIA
ncbi:MAG: FUSC family protein [Asticcacaulis sp.]|uniref:FUSC family protein n=1 Tax=Asticcacaulis sp. TaxID=1872648 RepID=UPI003F7C95B5